MIYLDHSATTPMSETALSTYNEVSRTYFGNESSLHDAGDQAHQLLRYNKEQLAQFINGEPDGFYFTHGGSDSNILALLSLAYGNKQRGKHIITSPLEHPSVYQALDRLRKEGFIIDEVAVNENGEVSLSSLQELLRPDTILVTICHAPSETGVIQPLQAIADTLPKEVVFHTDAVQSFGKIPIDKRQLGVDALSFSAHKVYGPKNTGAVYIDPQVSWRSIYDNVTHQHGFKPGTVDIPGITAFVAAAKELHENLSERATMWTEMRKDFIQQLNKDIFVPIGDQDNRLPHHIAMRARGFEGQWMMLECNRRGIAISSGSACKVSLSDPPKSLLAMGLTAEEAHGLFRISFGKGTTRTQLMETAKVLNEITSNQKQAVSFS